MAGVRGRGGRYTNPKRSRKSSSEAKSPTQSQSVKKLRKFDDPNSDNDSIYLDAEELSEGVELELEETGQVSSKNLATGENLPSGDLVRAMIEALRYEIRKSFEEELAEKDRKIEMLEERIDDLEMYGRRNGIRIHGVPETEKEDTDALVLGLADEIGAPIPDFAIGRSHRVGPSVEGRPRPIIAKFIGHNYKVRFLQKKSKLRKRNDSTLPPVYVNEDLTKKRADLAKRARQLKNDGKISDTWTRDGVIFVKYKDVRGYENMEEFLRGRGLSAKEIEKLQNDKIDEHVVPLMSDGDLSKYVPKYGDRIALLAFLRSSCNSETSTTDRKRALADRMLEEFCKGSKDSSWIRSRKALGNQNAKRRSRRIEIGWINYDSASQQYKQVRLKKGGGVRHCSMNGETNVSEILCEAKRLFFEGESGNSKQGHIDSFDIDLVDSTLEVLSDEDTICELYEKTKVKILRCYMRTKRINLFTSLKEKQADSSSEEFESTSTPTIFFRKTKTHRRNQSERKSSEPGLQLQTSSPPSPHRTTSPPSPHRTTSPPSPHRTTSPPSPHRTANPQSPHQTTSLPSPHRTTSLPLQLVQAPVSDYSSASSDTIAQDPTLTDQMSDMQYSSAIPLDLMEFTIDSGPSELTLDGILRWWQKRSLVSVDEIPQMLVSRSDILKSTLRLVKRDSFNFCSPFHIHFSGEDGDDFGGPRREFFRLLLSEICANVYQGPNTGKFFLHDLEKLSKGTYEMAGRLVAFSLLHDGPGIPVLHPLAYQILIEGESGMDNGLPNTEDCIFDLERREKLLSLQNATNQEEYEKVLDDMGDWCLEQSLSVLNFRAFAEKERLIDILKKNEIFYRVQSEIVQFKTGLNMVGGFLEAVLLAPTAMKPLFVLTSKSLRFRDIRNLYTINWSEDGSNNRQREEKAIYCLEAFLADCEGGSTDVSLEDMLSFWTGAGTVPPLGFHKNLEVDFTSTKQLPTAHTCSLILSIWRGFQDPDEFEAAMTKSVKWAGGFHLV